MVLFEVDDAGVGTITINRPVRTPGHCCWALFRAQTRALPRRCLSTACALPLTAACAAPLQGAMNSLSVPVFERLKEIALAVRTEKDIKVLILTAAGDRAFSAGNDVRRRDHRHRCGSAGRLRCPLSALGILCRLGAHGAIKLGDADECDGCDFLHDCAESATQ